MDQRKIRALLKSETITRELIGVYNDCKANLEHPDLGLYKPEDCTWVNKDTPFMRKLKEAHAEHMEKLDVTDPKSRVPDWGGRTRKRRRRLRKTRRSYK
jgi:hypothetical protein